MNQAIHYRIGTEYNYEQNAWFRYVHVHNASNQALLYHLSASGMYMPLFERDHGLGPFQYHIWRVSGPMARPFPMGANISAIRPNWNYYNPQPRWPNNPQPYAPPGW
jgi:hypothetical protein